jgi:hypothetical protein
MPEQLTRKQVELILRRTAELEQRDDDALDNLTPQDLEISRSESMETRRSSLHHVVDCSATQRA